jgi:hypothetical protein
MKKTFATLLAAAALLLASASPAQVRGNNGYDPGADPFAALTRAEAQARDAGKLVIVEAGGAWCRWCWAIDSFMRANPDVQAEFDRKFVRVKVYFGDENDNHAFFATLPHAKGYPHFWVLRADGRLLESVDTGPLEDGKDSYDKDAFLKFIRSAGRV